MPANGRLDLIRCLKFKLMESSSLHQLTNYPDALSLNYFWCFPSGYRDSALNLGPGSSVGIATELLAGRSGDRIPLGGEIFRTCPDRPGLLHNGYRVFPGGKERPGRDADPLPPSRAVVVKG